MKKKLISILFIAIVLTLSLALFCGCFFENLSIISGKLSGEALEALGVLAAVDEEESSSNMPTNFTQINKVSYSLGANAAEVTSVYKVTESAIFWSVTTVSNGVTQTNEGYLEADEGFYFVYARDVNSNEWKVGAVDEETFKAYCSQRSNGVSEDTRANLFNGKNYKSAGKKYKYTGPEVYIIFNQTKMVIDVEGLFVKDGGVEIKCKAHPELTAEQKAEAEAAGYNVNMPVSYSVTSVGSTTITFPKVSNPSYKNEYKNQH